MTIEERLKHCFTERFSAELKANTVVHELYHAAGSDGHDGRDLDRCLDVQFTGFNVLVESLSEANAELAAMATASHVGQLITVSEALDWANAQSDKSEHANAGKIVIAALADFDLDRDIELISRWTLLYLRNILVQIKKRTWDGDLAELVESYCSEGVKGAGSFDKRLLLVEITAELLGRDRKSPDVQQRLDYLGQLVTSQTALEEFEELFHTTRAQRVFESGLRCLMVRFCSHPDGSWNDWSRQAAEKFTRCRAELTRLKPRTDGSAAVVDSLNARLKAMTDIPALWSSVPPVILRTMEHVVCDHIGLVRELLDERLRELKGSVRSEQEAADKLREIVCRLLEKSMGSAYTDLNKALAAASDWLDKSRASYNTTAWTFSVGKLFVSVVENEPVSVVKQTCAAIKSGSQSMIQAVRGILKGMELSDIEHLIRKNHSDALECRKLMEQSRSAYEWLNGLAQSRPYALIDAEYWNVIFERTGGPGGTKYDRELFEQTARDFHPEVFDLISGLIKQVRHDQMFAALVWDPIVTAVHRNDIKEAEEAVTLMRSILCCPPNFVMEMADAVIGTVKEL